VNRLGVGLDGLDVVRAVRFGLVGDGRRLRAGLLKIRFVSCCASLSSLLRFSRAVGDLRKNILQLPRRDALHLAVVNDDAEMLLFGQIV
jgi:hypothetical protein